MKNQLLHSFLEQPENQKLYSNPNENIKSIIEERFKIHVLKIKILSYFSKVFYFEAQRFDKKIRENSLRNVLILDNDNDSDWVTYNDISQSLIVAIPEAFDDDLSEQNTKLENLLRIKKYLPLSLI